MTIEQFLSALFAYYRFEAADRIVAELYADKAALIPEDRRYEVLKRITDECRYMPNGGDIADFASAVRERRPIVVPDRLSADPDCGLCGDCGALLVVRSGGVWQDPKPAVGSGTHRGEGHEFLFRCPCGANTGSWPGMTVWREKS